MVRFNPATDIPTLHGKVCLVTGANSGLGEATVAALAQHQPGVLYLAARSHSKAEAALSRIKATSTDAASADIRILDLDISSFDSVKAAAAKVQSEVDRLDILQLNAGVALVPHATTTEGYEVHFGTNYLGHALLTQLLMSLLLKTAALPNSNVRIVSMSSAGHRVFAHRKGIFFDELKTDMASHSSAELYGQTNLGKTLFAFELAKRYPQITSTSIHPGTVKSDIWGKATNINSWFNSLVVKPLVAISGVSNEEGAKNQLWCAFSPDVENGRYYEPVGKAGKDGPLSRDEQMAKRLWEWTEKELAAGGGPGWPSA
jgi:NAD(P)-dependent dehydrogenase (short-subunit alcohol dehydrogenase family)